MRDLERILETALGERLNSSIPLEVTCSLHGNTLAVVVHAPNSLELSSNDIFMWTRDILAHDTSLSDYHLKTYLMVHEDDSSMLVPFKSFNPPLRGLNLWWEKFISPRLSLRLLSTGLGLAAAITLAYALSRPCVLGDCPDLIQAQKSAKEAIRSIDLSATDYEVRRAEKVISNSLNILRSIPPWSGYHSQAQSLAFTYQESADQLQQLNQALLDADNALSMIQKAPLASEQWQRVQSLWQKAIFPLAKIPPDSNFYGFSQVKLYQYRSYLAKASKSLESEKISSSSLADAEKLAKVAHIKHNSARSADDWQSVLSQWQAVTSRLQGINSQTSSYKKAKQLLDLYLPLQLTAQKNLERENLTLVLFNRATDLAARAESSADKSQWLQAHRLWKQALITLQQIPINTFQYERVQPLLTVYSSSLKGVEKKLNFLNQQEIIREDIKTLCLNICSFTISDNLIKVFLKPNYTNQVRRTAIAAQQGGSIKTEIDLLNHLSRLESSLQTISNNSQKVLQVYNSEGSLISIYEPRK